MFCKACNQSCKTRAEFLLHVSVCGNSERDFHNRYSPLSEGGLSPIDEEDSPADDSDADPHWLPSPAMSSPLTQEQIDLSGEAEAILNQSRPNSKYSLWLDDNITIADHQRVHKERECVERIETEGTRSDHLKSSLVEDSATNISTAPPQQKSEKRISLEHKLQKLKVQLDEWNSNRKEAFRNGKRSAARRLGRSLSKAKRQYNEISQLVNNDSQEQEQVQPMPNQTQAKKTSDRKRNYCMYCDKLVVKFCQHIEAVHKNTPEGISILALNGGIKLTKTEKTKITDNIRKHWNHLYNEKNPMNQKILVKKRHSGENPGNVTCKHCLGLYRRDKLSVHLKTCDRYKVYLENYDEDTGQAIKAHSILSLPFKNLVSQEFHAEILNGVSVDDVMTTALHDKTIMLFANDFHESRREQKSKNYIIRQIRDLARLLAEIKILNPTIRTFEEALNPAHFDTVIKAALKMAGYDQETGSVRVPSIAYRISQPLNECLAMLKSLETKSLYKNETEDRRKLTMYQDFSKQIESQWKTKIGRICRKALKVAKVDKVQVIADQSDIIKLAAHIEGSYKKIVKKLKDQKDSATYNILTHSLITHIMLLVRRRPVDFKLAKLRHYGNVDRNEEILQMTEKDLSQEELDVCKQFHIFYVPGKNLDIVPIVLTRTMRTVLDILIEHRHHVNVSSDTLFVLANDKPIQPTESMRILKLQVKLKKPGHLSGNGLRHQAATFSRLHSAHPQYQDFLASVLGHSLHIHKKNYELPVGILQKLMVCPILHNIMRGEKSKKSVVEEVPAEVGIAIPQEEQPTSHKRQQMAIKRISNNDKCKSDSEEDSNNEETYESPKKKKVKWSETEQDSVLFYFRDEILRKEPPKRSQVTEFLQKYPDICKDRSVDQVYLYLRNHALRQQRNVTPKVKAIVAKRLKDSN